ncbi:hypothetical protein KM043_010936 [Ampulex compressa]|nr:hypothetical protein KM043_010936 [Ampulex compressa]
MASHRSYRNSHKCVARRAADPRSDAQGRRDGQQRGRSGCLSGELKEHAFPTREKVKERKDTTTYGIHETITIDRIMDQQGSSRSRYKSWTDPWTRATRMDRDGCKSVRGERKRGRKGKPVISPISTATKSTPAALPNSAPPLSKCHRLVANVTHEPTLSSCESERNVGVVEASEEAVGEEFCMEIAGGKSKRARKRFVLEARVGDRVVTRRLGPVA